MVSQIGTFQPHAQHHKNLVSTDSLDDKDKFVAQLFVPRSSPNNVSLQTCGSQNNPMTWTNPLLQSTGGLRYPMMGMSVMGPTHDASVLYGLIGTTAANVQRNATVNIPSQNSVLVLSSMNPSSSISEPVAMSGTCDTKCLAGIQDSKVVNLHDSTTVIQCKDIIHCKSCTLFPPNPSTPPPTTREKPPGCRTVFVGGLPGINTFSILLTI
jgi:hypothetical protein